MTLCHLNSIGVRTFVISLAVAFEGLDKKLTIRPLYTCRRGRYSHPPKVGRELTKMTQHDVWSRTEQETVTGALARAAAEFGPRIFLDFSGETYTYSDIDRESTRL